MRSIKPFFFKLTKVRSIVLFVTPTSIAISSAVISGLLINNPSTAFSVLFIPTFVPTFIPTFYAILILFATLFANLFATLIATHP